MEKTMNNPLTEQDFKDFRFRFEILEKVQSAKRMLKKEIKERVHFEFPSDRNMALHLIDACFQISEGDDKK